MKLSEVVDMMSEFKSYFWERKVWWILPMVLVLLVFGFLIVVTQSATVAPFIYAIF